MTVVLLTGDLVVMSRVSGAAAQKSVDVQTASNARQAAESCREHSAQMLIVDLSTPSLNVAELVAAVNIDNDSPPTIVAFGPHVHEERLAAARDAGCDRVVSRGQFFGQLDTLLQL
jgi:DNA-binding NarL/FixJ family response regulator